MRPQRFTIITWMEHTLPSARSVEWTMAAAKHSAMFSPSADGGECNGHTGATTVGKWTYTPVSTSWDPDKSATLQHEGQEVPLHYSSSIFEDFLQVMSRIQNEFNRRSQYATPFTTSLGERSGQMSRV